MAMEAYASPFLCNLRYFLKARRGQWKAATQSQEFIWTLQRYLRNAYMDANKQDAINLFLGHFQPDSGRPALWELDLDHLYRIGSLNPSFSKEISRYDIVYIQLKC